MSDVFESPAEGVDNLAAAVEQAASGGLGRKKKVGASDQSDVQQVLIRASRDSHERWKQAAEAQGVSMSEFVRSAADAAAADLLDCSHGVEHRRWYPWAEFCLKCGVQLRQEKKWLVDPATFPHTRPLAGNPAVMR